MSGEAGLAILPVRVRPGASKNAVLAFEGGVLHLSIAAPPERGKANLALIAFLAGLLAVPRGNVALLKGGTSRRKVLGVAGLSSEELHQRLSRLSDSPKG